MMIAKRSLSTLIPPKIVSAKNLGSAPNAKRIVNVVQFYKSLPQGSAPAVKPSGLIGRYKAKYFDGDNASGKPLWHLALAIMTMGYSLEYYFHLRHAKDGEHH
ncbi:ATP17 (YDR377W) [Zygosaccharomyces parabailii]|nr:ATP17 (YDR377W) [Zygosaccharomyces parabailii]AQZ11005.1 ATP17 (YDR377W) [Zygosaccharomyces parabailii]CDH12326.1 probable ATP synthase subunit f, mitochondrial [Zygosaccharomyces bailii ISA1307]